MISPMRQHNQNNRNLTMYEYPVHATSYFLIIVVESNFQVSL